MKILIAAMGRTGSHLLQHIVEDLRIGDVRHANHKTNNNLFTWADVVVSTKRDMREQIASTVRTMKVQGLNHRYSGNNTLIQELDMSMNTYNFWKDKVNKTFCIEDWHSNPKKYIQEILNYFKLEKTNKEIQTIVEKFYSKEVIPKHITCNNEIMTYKKTLNKEEINVIMKYFKEKYYNNFQEFIYLENYI